LSYGEHDLWGPECTGVERRRKREEEEEKGFFK
jgi:hypothetical protein